MNKRDKFIGKRVTLEEVEDELGPISTWGEAAKRIEERSNKPYPKLTEKEIGERDRLATKKMLGEELDALENLQLEILNRRLEKEMPPLPELPENVKQANIEAEELLKERIPERRS